MAEINVASQLSYGELAKRLNEDGSVRDIFEAMNERNDVFKFIPAVQCNKRDTHIVTRRTSLGTGTWRKYYKGSAKTSTTTQVQEFGCALLEARSEIDEDIIDAGESPAERESLRRTEDKGIALGMGEQVMDAIIYGSTTGTPEQIDGLTSYLNALSQTLVFDGGNAGGTSIYVVDFSAETCFMIYPKGKTGGPLGLDVRTNPDGGNGKKWVTDGDGNEYLAYCTQFKWWVGFVVRDMLSIGRIANVNPTVGGAGSFDENDLIELLNYGNFKARSTYILCTKEIKAQMQIRAKDKANVNFTTVNALSGEEVTMFGGYAPVLRCDAISTSESTVT